MSLILDGTWKMGKPLSSGRNTFSCVAFEEKLYCTGGNIGFGTDNTDDLEIYDIRKNTWTTGKPMPEGLHMLDSVLVGKVIYCVGGRNQKADSDKIYIYDTTTNEWSISSYTLPTARYGLKCCYVNNKIYCVGGYGYDNVEILDLESGTWINGQPLPIKVGDGCLQYYEGKLIWCGGYESNRIYIYDIENDSWTEGAELPLITYHGYVSNINDGKIIFTGGYSLAKHQNVAFIYDIKNNTFITLPSMPYACSHSAGALVNGVLYQIGGASDEGFHNFVQTYQAFLPETSPIGLQVVLEPGEQLQLSVDDELAVNTELTWSSSDNLIAGVNGNGVVNALALGESIITAASDDGTYQDQIDVLVVEDAIAYRLSVDLTVGEFCRLKIKGLSDGTPIKWTSMDATVATVTGKGVARAVSNGLALVTAADDKGNIVGQVYVRVRE